MKSDVKDWSVFADVYPAEWAPAWPMLEPEHLRPGDLYDEFCRSQPNPNSAPIHAWAYRMHVHFAQSIPRSALMVIAHLIDVSPLLADGKGVTGQILWDRLHADPYRDLLAYAWNKTAHAYGYEVDEDELIHAQWQRVVAACAGPGFDREVLFAPPRPKEIVDRARVLNRQRKEALAWAT